jgi:hypothetical protein
MHGRDRGFGSNVLCMLHRFSCLRICLLVLGFPGLAPGAGFAEQPAPAATATFNAYVSAVESQLAQQHGSPDGFLGAILSDPGKAARLRSGELIVEQRTPASGAPLPGGMLHHWRATAFVPGADAAGFDRLMRNFSAWPRIYAPQVLQVKLLAQQADDYRILMRVRQRHVLTVVMDTSYDISFGRLDPQHRFNASRSTQISEIDSSGRTLSPAAEHGFLWRQNTYWSCAERDGGLYLQIESVSLTRSIPAGLAWAIGPFVESVPRGSLEFTLRATGNALRGAQ